jgi:hypothetical protein
MEREAIADWRKKSVPREEFGERAKAWKAERICDSAYISYRD